MVSLKMIESPVIFTTYPLKTGSFSRRKYALFMALTTTAIMPASDFTIPVRATWSTARQRLPVLQPDPPILWFTTGLTNGSRRPPAMLILWSSFFGSTGFFLSSTATAAFGSLGWSTATLVVFFAVVFGAAALAAGLAAFAGETVAACAFEACAGDAVSACAVLDGFPAAGFAAVDCGAAFCPCEVPSAALISAVFCC